MHDPTSAGNGRAAAPPQQGTGRRLHPTRRCHDFDLKNAQAMPRSGKDRCGAMSSGIAPAVIHPAAAHSKPSQGLSPALPAARRKTSKPPVALKPAARARNHPPACAGQASVGWADDGSRSSHRGGELRRVTRTGGLRGCSVRNALHRRREKMLSPDAIPRGPPGRAFRKPGTSRMSAMAPSSAAA
jgi:hypothetical protein